MVLTTNMVNRPQIEEVSDSDPEIEDIDRYLPDDSNTIIAPADIPKPATRIPPQQNARFPPSEAGLPPQEMLRPTAPGSNAQSRAQKEAIKAFHSLYPVYFDSSRTLSEGRRVSSKLAVSNPLARTIVDAVSSIFNENKSGPPINIAFEPDKLHPKDWANPGRVRIKLRDKETGKWLGGSIVKNKSHLYIKVAEYLQANPTTKISPLALQIAGVPTPEKLDPPAKPKGWKINDILPLHSPAISGGGVSENMFKDMMAQMQGAGGGGPQLPPGMAGMAGALGGPSGSSGGGVEPTKKKEKKEKKKGKA